MTRLPKPTNEHAEHKMVAIVSGNSLGLSLTSMGTLGRFGVSGSAEGGRNGQSTYVNVANGNLVVQSQDDYLASRGLDAAAVRTYNSQGLLNDDNGDNWSSGAWVQPLALTGALNSAGSTLKRTDRDGSVSTYAYDATRSLYASTDGGGAHDTITYLSAEQRLEWRDGDQALFQRYEAAGSYRLVSSHDSSGNALTYAYNDAGQLSAVTTASGETTFYDYNGNNLAQIRTTSIEGGTVVRARYSYDAVGRLSGVTVDLTPDDYNISDGKVYQTAYIYDGASKRIAGITQADGTSLAFTYIDLGGGSVRIATVKDSLGRTTSFTYASGYTTVTDPQGNVTRYDMDTAGRLLAITPPAVLGGLTGPTQFAYNVNGDLLSTTDGEGRTVHYEYDVNGNQVLQRDHAGNTVTRTYSGVGQLLTETLYLQPDPDGAAVGQPGLPLTTRYVYDSANRNLLRFAVSPEGRVTEYRYNGYGEQVTSVRYLAGGYPVGRLAAGATLSEVDLVAWAGTQEIASTSRVDTTYDARGQAQSRVAYAHVDVAGAGISDGTQTVEQYVYDQTGLLLKTISGTNGATSYTYDGLGRVLSTTNALGQVSLTQYGDSTRKIVLTLANGLVTTSTYDAASRLVSVIQSGPSSSLGETKYFYDASNQLRMTEDPTGVRSWMFYDEAGRRTAEVDGNGTMTEYTYGRNNLVTRVDVWGTAVNIATLVDANGQPVMARASAIRPAASSKDSSIWRAYDAANRLVREARSVGSGATAAVTETKYDGSSRVTHVVSYATVVATDGGPGAVAPGVVPLPAASSQDRVSRNFYNADGQLAGTLDAEGYLTVFSYNAAGQLVKTVAYAASTDPALRGAGTLTQIAPATSAADIRTFSIYNGKGQVAARIDGEGYFTEYIYDLAGNVTQTVRYAIRVAGEVTATSTVASLRPAASAADRTTLRAYDALNRVTQETSAEGIVTQNTYDNVGNLVATVRAAGTGEARSILARFDLQRRLVGELSALGAALLTGEQTQAEIDAIWQQYGSFHSYDAAGRRTSTTNSIGARTLFYYNADGALTHTINALGEVRETRYDDVGRVLEEHAYSRRISTVGLTGGLVTAALTSATAAAATGTDLRARYTYTKDGQVSTSYDGQGHFTYRTYNAFGDEIQTSQDLGGGQTLTQAHITDRRGLRTATVIDPSNSHGLNASSTISYDAFGRAIRTIDTAGNVREQSFDRLGQIVTTRDPLNTLRSTSYDAFGGVLTQSDGLGSTTKYAYDAQARTLTVTTPEGVVTTTSYNRHGQTQSVADGKGQITSYIYDRNGQLQKTTTPLTEHSSTYDAAGRMVEAVDANGNKVIYTYDAANRVLTRRVDPTGLNLTTTYAYDGKGQAVSVTDANGVSTVTEYDNKGQTVRQTVDPSGLNLQTTYTYSSRGSVLTITTPGGTSTQYVYDALGRRIQERIDPAGLNLQRNWTYDKNGNVTSNTDALGNVTRYAYDAQDRLVFTLDPLSNVRQVSYDAAGRVVKTVSYAKPISTVGLGNSPTAAEIGPLLISEAAQDVVEHRVYDRDGRVAATVDGTGAVVRYTYDANGNVLMRVAHAARVDLQAWVVGSVPAPVANGLHDDRQLTVYDSLNRAVYTINGIGAVVAQTYDGNGNVLQRTAYATAIPTDTAATQAALAAATTAIANTARDATVRNTYDAANRLTWSTNGTGAAVQRIYDRNGNLVRETAYANPVGAGAAPSAVTPSANDRVNSMAYDSANRLVLHVDALKSVSERVYDANGNVVRQTEYANRISSVPALATPETASSIRSLLIPNAVVDRSTRFGYDAAGRQSLVIDATGAVTETQYDAAGQAVAVISYANLVNTNSLAAVPTLSSLKALVTANVAMDRTAKSAYDAAGQRVYNVDALGAVTSTQYDGVGRVTRTTRHALAIPATTANTAAGIAMALVAHGADQTDLFSYNAASQLITATDALGQIESYIYDALGNKLTFTNKAGAVWSYTYDAASQLLIETSPLVSLTTVTTNGSGAIVAGAAVDAAVVTQMTYDALGNLTQRTEGVGRPEQRTTRYEYDAVGRQIRVIHPPVGVYNAAGDPVTTNGAAGIATRVENAAVLETYTFYDALGNAVASRDIGGAISQKAYDLLGRVVYDVDALGYITGYARNTFGEVTHLTRYGGGTGLGNGVLSDASQSATKGQIDALLASSSFNHTQDRVLVNLYDRAGRVTQTSEPAAYVYDANAGTAGSAAKTTRNTYDAFGQLIRAESLRNASNSWAITTHYYDKAGRQQATVDALGYLTWRAFDAVGNLTEVREYATARAADSWSLTSYGALTTPVGNDRTIRYSYDRLSRKTHETRVDVEFSTAPDGTSTRGNLTTAFAYDAVGNQTAVTDADGRITYTHYDAIGRIVAVAAPTHSSTASGASLAPLTVFRRDAYGNVVVKVEHANGASGPNSKVATASVDDRITLAVYDSFGRSTQTTNANGASEFYSYDAYGHVAKRWQGVTGSDGITRTSFEVNVYDKLGQLIETRTPASTTVLQGGLTAAYTPPTTDENGFEITPHRMQLSWSSLVDVQGATVRVQVDYIASASSVHDENGNVISGQAAHLASHVQDFSAINVGGGAELTWTAATDSVAYIRVMQLVGGQWVTKWEGAPAQASGSGIATLSQSQAGLVYAGMEYNAFGELTRRGAQGGRQEYFDYDTAGRLWRTNSGDGVDRISLFDAQGNVTSEIRSSGSGRDNVDIKGFVNAQAADANPYTRRTDIRYDALGRITSQTQAVRLELQGGVSVQRPYTTAPVTGRPFETYDEYGSLIAWSGSNEVALAWNNLSGLGSGDVKVYIEYRTPVVTNSAGTDESGLPTPVTYSGGLLRSYASGIFNGDAAATGVSLSWEDAASMAEGGVGHVTRIVVYKKDINGIWQHVMDQAPGHGGNYIDVAAPANPGSGVTLELKAAGSTTWWPVGLVDYGSGYRFDARGLPLGSYEYRVTVRSPGEADRVTGTGTLSLTQPPLNSITTPITYGQAGAGVLAWQRPGEGTDQVLRYRPYGSSGAWSTLAVNPWNGGTLDGVDTSWLAAGSYQFELLWTTSGQGVPGAHATGHFTITAATAAYWVPPVNLPNIGGLRIGSAYAGGYGEDGQPIASGPFVSALEWNLVDTNTVSVRYRLPGGAWNYLGVHSSEVFTDESGNVYGTQRVLINGLAPGAYQVEVLGGSPVTHQATGNLTIYAQSPGYYQTITVQVATYQPVISHYDPVYETRYGTRQVAYSVWVHDPPYVVGYDEHGYEIWAYPGHWETRYRTETYAYQVQVGWTPVYATDENGNVVYQTVWVSQQQQQWVPGTTPAPTVAVTTPPYSPGYTVAAVPVQYGVSVTTASGSQALSTLDGTVMAQSAGINGGDRWLRPTIEQKTDRWGNVVEITDPRSAYWKTTYQYNASNQLVREAKPDASGSQSVNSPATQIYYDKLGRQVAVRDANGNVNGQVFDATGNLIEERRADGGVVSHRYNAFGDKVKTTDAMGGVITFTYDKLGYMLSMVQGQAGVYRANGANYLEYVATRHITESWTYDQLGRKLTQTNGNNETLSYVYDLRGNVVETRQPLGQVVRAAFDAQGRKIAEVDANGFASTWSYDYFGRVTGHTDLGGARYAYSYDHARQLVYQSSTRGQSISYAYDAAGQQTSITDWATGKLTTYVYDLSGRRIRERVTQGGITYQDNHLAYDAQGNLRDVADARAHVYMEYDKAGNRTRVYTHVNYQGTGGEAGHASDKYFKYDAMNRQVVVDGVDPAGNIAPHQGHQITYDKNGNRTSDTYWGNRVTTVDGQQVIVGYSEDGTAIYSTTPTSYGHSTGWSTEQYRYDALNRLQSVVRDGVQIDVRHYDGAGRVVQSGPGGTLPQAYADLINVGVQPGQTNGQETRINRYDANGRLLHQKVLKSDNAAKMDISWDAGEAYGTWGMYRADGYDATGNALGYVVANHENGMVNEYTTSLTRYEGYLESVTDATSNQLNSGSSTQHYDANGYLVGLTDATQGANNRTLVNDAAGRALYVNQAGHMQRQLIANGEVLGTYGVGVDPFDPATGRKNNPNFANLVDFDFGYAKISASYPNASPGAYQVRTGDTLQTIAQSAYGDSSLWYRIADANGLGGNSDMRVGQTLNIPNRVGTVSNNNSTFKPYDPTRLEGDTTPNMTMPKKDDCGGLGQILMVIVAVAITVYSGGTMAGAAIGSIAGQMVGLATGTIEKFSWKQVALSAISAGITQGLPTNMFPTGVGGVVARAAVGNALTQGVGVVTGLQNKFDWRGVAASAAAAGVSYGVSESLGITNEGIKTGAFKNAGFGEQLFKSTLTGLAAGTTAAVMRGGKVAVQQVASDAFGNAIGSSLAEAASSPGTSTMGAGPANRTPRFGELGSGTYGVEDVDGLTFASFAPQNPGPAAGSAAPEVPFVDFDEYDRMGTPREVGTVGKEHDEHIARMLRLANEPGAAGTAARDRLQPDGSFRGTITEALSTPPQVGALNGADAWIPNGPLPQDGGTVVGRGMTPAEMEEFDRLHPEIAAELAAKQRSQAFLTPYVPGVWEQVWHSQSVQHALNNSMTGTVLSPIVQAAGTAWASFVRKDGYNFATNRHMNPVERINGRIDSVINVASALIPGGGAARMMRAEMTEAQMLRGGTAGGVGNATATLSRIEGRFAKASREVGFIVDSESGAILTSARQPYGQPRASFRFSDEQWAMAEGNWITHNHPSGNTLGLEDLAGAVSSGARGVRASTNSGVYELTFDSSFASAYRGEKAGAAGFLSAETNRIGAGIMADVRSGALVVPANLTGPARNGFLANEMWIRYANQTPGLRYTFNPR